MKSWVVILIHAAMSFIAVFASVFLNRSKETKQDRKMYIALMIGGFVWSQLQTEYLIWRIKKDTKKALSKS